MNTRIKSLVAIISLVVTLIAAGTLYARANTTNRIEGNWASSNEIAEILQDSDLCPVNISDFSGKDETSCHRTGAIGTEVPFFTIAHVTPKNAHLYEESFTAGTWTIWADTHERAELAKDALRQ